MAIISWGTPVPSAGHLALQVTAPLVNNGRWLAPPLNPSGYIYSAWCFDCNFATSPTAGGGVDLYLVPALDGTNYGLGGSGVDPSNNNFLVSFPTVMIANSGQKLTAYNVLLNPFTCVPVIKNRTGQTIPTSSGVLTAWFYNEKIE